MNGNPSSQYINTNSNNPAAGQVRFNGSNMEVYDGNMWTHIIMSYPSIGLSVDAENALNWISKKINEEHKLAEIAKDNPTVADALASVREAEDKLKVVVALTQQEK